MSRLMAPEVKATARGHDKLILKIVMESRNANYVLLWIEKIVCVFLVKILSYSLFFGSEIILRADSVGYSLLSRRGGVRIRNAVNFRQSLLARLQTSFQSSYFSNLMFSGRAPSTALNPFNIKNFTLL